MIRTVTRRNNRVLVIDIVFRRPDGTKGRYRRDAQIQTKAAAQAEERRLLAELAQKGDIVTKPASSAASSTASPAEKPWTWADAVKSYQEGKAVVALKPSTRVGYAEIFTKRLGPAFGDLPLDAIDGERITKLDADLVQEGLSPSRRRNVAICIRSVLREAHRHGKLAKLPAWPPLPKKGRKILPVLTEDQADAIVVHSGRWTLAFGLALYAGLRAGEVRALRWSDVDLVARVLVVRLSRSCGQTSTPKSGHEREIPLCAPLFRLLEAGGTGLVCPGVEGRPLDEKALIMAVRRACKRAGLARWRFHNLRHYFVTEMFRRGASAPAVQALAGHADLATTQKYAHMVQSDLRATVALLG